MPLLAASLGGMERARLPLQVASPACVLQYSSGWLLLRHFLHFSWVGLYSEGLVHLHVLLHPFRLHHLPVNHLLPYSGDRLSSQLTGARFGYIFSDNVALFHVSEVRQPLIISNHAFVNLITPEEAARFVETFTGFCQWLHSQSWKVCSVSWAELQGLLANVQNVRTNLVMGKAVTDECKPAIYCNGRKLPFPRSYKKLRSLALALSAQ